ncbi:hypothetical protein ACT3TB_16445 [Micrococcaceae sp. AOP34-BR2-30]
MTVTITLTDDQAAGITALIEMAERGRENSEAQNTRGNATGDNLAAQVTAAALADAQRPGVAHPIIEAVERWIVCAADMDTDNLWEHFTCNEAEATANIARAAGRADIADTILDLHSQSDDPGDMHYRPDSTANGGH